MLAGRVDLDSLHKACLRMENFIPRVFGGAFRRPPSLHIAMASTPTYHARLIPFIYSTQTKYIIELGNFTARFWDGSQANVVAATVATPWPSEALDAIQFAQVNDVMWFTHPDYHPQELQRVAEFSWTINPLPWLWPAMRDSGVALSSFAETPMGDLTLGASSTTEYVHSISGLPGPALGAYKLLPGGVTLPGGVRIYSSGTWVGTITIQRSTDRTVWATVGVLSGSASSAPLLRSEFYHAYPYFRLIVARTSGTGTVSPVSTVATVVPVGEIQIVCNGTTGTGHNLNTSAPFFKAGHVGAYFQIGHFRETLTSEITYGPGGPYASTSPPISVNGKWEFYTVGRWSGDIFLEQQNGAGGWDVLRKFTGALDHNVTAGSAVIVEGVLRLRTSNVAAASASDIAYPRFVLSVLDGRVYGLVKVTAVYSATQAVVDVIKPLWSTAVTGDWYEGAWSTERGFPHSVTLHEQRLMFAGTKTDPLTIWASTIGDLRNFQRTGYDDGGFSYTIAAQESNPITWMVSTHGGLILGTYGDEWLMSGGDTGITPSNVSIKRQSRYGSEPIQAQAVNAVALFVRRGGQSLLEYVYQWDAQTFVAPNVSQLVRHMLTSGIRCFGWAQNTEGLIWVVTNDGQLLSCTYHRDEQVIAWARHPMKDGLVESLAIVNGAANASDEVWLVVSRYGQRSLERLDPYHFQRLEGAGGVIYHLDAAIVQSSATPFTSVTGISHLEGKSVRVIANGATQDDVIVLGGTVTVPHGTTHAAVGLSMASILQPMPIEIPIDTGTSQGRKFRVAEMALRLFQTGACSYSDGPESKVYELPFRTAAMSEDQAAPLFSGVKRVNMSAIHRDQTEFVLQTDSPLPLNVLSVIPSLQIYGD